MLLCLFSHISQFFQYPSGRNKSKSTGHHSHSTKTAAAIQPHRAVTLLAPLSASAHKLRVRAEPGAPGLVFTARHRAYVPWTAPEGAPVVVSVTPPSGLRAGGGGQVAVRVASPSDTPVDVVVGLPAGVRADEAVVTKVEEWLDQARVAASSLDDTTARERFASPSSRAL